MMDIKQYQNVNESFQRRLIYHVGNNCGFFVELNYMLNAMLYCLEHGLRFQIYFDALSSAGHPPRGLSTSQFSVLSLSPWAHKHPPRGLGGLPFFRLQSYVPLLSPASFWDILQKIVMNVV